MNIQNVIQSVSVFLLTLTYLSLFEYAIHRFPMHMEWLGKPKLPPLFRHLYVTHTVEHHSDFSSRKYERLDDDHSDITLIKPLLLLGLLLIIMASLPIFWIDWMTNYQLHLTAYCVPMACVYYVMFETIHVAEHKPASLARKICQRFVGFEALQKHHKKHHSSWKVNFNLVCPIGDFVCGSVEKTRVNKRIIRGVRLMVLILLIALYRSMY